MSHYLDVPSFDGPSDTRSRDGSQYGGSHSRHHSQGGPSQQAGGSRAGGSSRPPSNVGTGAGPVGYPAALGYDPARLGPNSDESPEIMHRRAVGKRVDLPAEAYVEVRFQNKMYKFSNYKYANFDLRLDLRPSSLIDLASERVENRSILASTNSASPVCPALMSISMT